jgi:archaellum component FlaF (FlaF/FlaG flagellin family)
MKKIMSALVVLALVSVVAMAQDKAAAPAADAAKAVVGKVMVTKNDKGEATKVEIKGADGKAVVVKMDENGKKVAEMADKEVEATGKMVGEELVVEKVAEKKADKAAAPAVEKK